MLCGGGGQHYLVSIIFQHSILSKFNNIFHVKGLKKINYLCQINMTIGERPIKKNVESLDLT